MADASQLRRNLEQLFAAQQDDQRLRDHLEGTVRDDAFPGLTWFWGPALYERNRVVFRSVILNHFSDWSRSGLRWRRIKWSEHAPRLEAWLAAARAHRDTQLVRRLLRWKYAGSGWGIDHKGWNAALVADYQAAPTAAARAIVLDEYDDWFQLDENSALALYTLDRASGPFILKHLPQTFWMSEKRTLWERFAQATLAAGDEKAHFELYRKQVPVKQWRTDVLALAQRVQQPEKLVDELERRHPSGYGLGLRDTLVQLLEARGRDVMPYIRGKLKETLGGWYGDNAKPFVAIAEKNQWWDLWAAAIRANRDNKLLNGAVAKLLDDGRVAESERVGRLKALAGASREWNWAGIGFAQVHALEDGVAELLYRRYPELIRGPFKPNVTPTWWQGFPKLLQAARDAGDDELVDLLASRYATQWHSGYAFAPGQSRSAPLQTADSLGDYYQSLRDRDANEFARRAANVLTRVPAFAIYNYNQLLQSNKLARLLFVRSFDAYLADAAAVRDLVEGSEIHVQQLAYRVLAQDDDRARRIAVDALDILLGTLLRPLHRKTRLAAFGALINAARGDPQAAARILARAREALRLPDKKYPKEQLVGLIGQILHERPELRGPREQPVVYGLQEAVA